MHLLSSIVICVANIAFVTTHLSSSVIMSGKEKRKTSGFLILSSKRVAKSFVVVVLVFVFLQVCWFFFFIYKVAGFFC